MATDPLKKRVVDPVYELFWKEVATAVDMVSNNHERQIAVAVGDRKASVIISNQGSMIKVLISEYTPVQPTLIVPPGGSVLDPRDSQPDDVPSPTDTETGGIE